MNLNDVNAEWKKAFIAEQKSLYGNVPTDCEILANCEMNKDYFYSLQNKEI